MPTAAHVIYIPAVLLLGVVLGYILGSRAARDAIAAEHELYAEKVNFILNRMRLDAMVGELTDAQLEQANKLLM